LFLFLTKKIHEKTPTVKISNAAAAIVMPAICAIERLTFPDTETPSGPALTVVCVIAVVDGGIVVVDDERSTTGVAAVVDVDFVVVMGSDVELCVAVTAPDMPPQMGIVEVVFD
jgi:uncharacterized lipoprotein YajG